MAHKSPPAEMGQQANQIGVLPVAPSAESQKREIVARLNELAGQMKIWAVQVEGLAMNLGSLAVEPHKNGTQSPSDSHFRHAPPNGQLHAHYSASPHYKFQAQQLPRPITGHTAQLSQVSPVQPTSALDETEKSGKRRRRNDSTRRKKDPHAPKRPPSAYILYQNDVRKQMQDKYPDMTYAEVLGKIAESWQTLEESKKKAYLDMVERDKLRYEDEKLKYNSGQSVSSKPTSKRSLSGPRAPSDPDPDGDAEAEPEPEEEEDTGEQCEEQPNAKRTRIKGSDELPARNAESQSPLAAGSDVSGQVASPPVGQSLISPLQSGQPAQSFSVPQDSPQDLQPTRAAIHAQVTGSSARFTNASSETTQLSPHQAHFSRQADLQTQVGHPVPLVSMPHLTQPE